MMNFFVTTLLMIFIVGIGMLISMTSAMLVVAIVSFFRGFMLIAAEIIATVLFLEAFDEKWVFCLHNQ